VVKQRPVRSRVASHAAEREMGEAKWAMAPSDDFRSISKEWPTHVGGDDRRPQTPSTLHVVSTATGNGGGRRDRATVPGGQTETGR
jgi:hypothetical protein